MSKAADEIKKYREDLKEFNKQHDRELKLAEDERSLQKFKSYTDRLRTDAEASYAKGFNIQSKAGAVRAGMELGSWIKPFIIGAVVLFFIIGPGLSAIMQVIGALNLWMWLLVLVIGLLFWRNWR